MFAESRGHIAQPDVLMDFNDRPFICGYVRVNGH